MLVKSVRGAYGGYMLSKEAKDITAGDIIRVLEGPISPVEVMDNEEPAKRDLWIKIRDAVKNVLDETTLYATSDFAFGKIVDPLSTNAYHEIGRAHV